MSSKKKSNWKKREGVVYSTSKDFDYKNKISDITQEQNIKNSLHVYFTKKGRGGKIITVIEGLSNNPFEMSNTAKKIKQECGVGGSVKDGEIIIQGKMVEKIKQILIRMGFSVK